jgi:hypothetical protein
LLALKLGFFGFVLDFQFGVYLGLAFGLKILNIMKIQFRNPGNCMATTLLYLTCARPGFWPENFKYYEENSFKIRETAGFNYKGSCVTYP